jgi:hypothetical protein
MAKTTSCTVCGILTNKHEYGHVHFTTRSGQDKTLTARHCNKHVHLSTLSIRKHRNVIKDCGLGCYGEWKIEDGLQGHFKNPKRGSYPAIWELVKDK